MSLYGESFVLKYRKGDKFSVTIIAKGLDSLSAVNILMAVLTKDFQYVHRMKDKFNFECIVIENDAETVF